MTNIFLNITRYVYCVYRKSLAKIKGPVVIKNKKGKQAEGEKIWLKHKQTKLKKKYKEKK